MVDTGAGHLVALAKRHLGLPASTPDKRVPAFYLEELRDHLKQFPLEDNFRVTLQPKIGFGTVKCLKDGCNEVIPLTPRVKREDDGKKDGLGSMSAFWGHLSSHLLRETRVRTRSVKIPSAQSASSIKAENVPPSLSRPLTRLASLSRANIKAPSASTSSLVKAEPVQSTIPRKRHSDTALIKAKTEPTDGDLVFSTPQKKLKVTPKSPLAEITNFASTSLPSNSLTAMYSRPLHSTDYRSELQNVQAAISRQQRDIALVNLLPASSREPRMGLMNAQLSQLQSSEAFWKSCIPGPTLNSVETEVAPVENIHAAYMRPQFATKLPISPKIEATVPHQALVAHSVTHTSPRLLGDAKLFVKKEYREASPVPPRLSDNGPPRKSHVALRAFPMDLDDSNDEKPFNNPFFSSSPAPAPRQLLKLASSSSTPPSDDSKADVFAARDIKSFAPRGNAVASSSRAVHVSPQRPLYDHKPRIPGTYVDVSDDDLDLEDPVAHLMVTDIDAIAERVGINIAPLPGYDAHDANGDYYGRGRDLYVGPQAAEDDIEKFLIEAGNSDSFDGNETVDKALAYLGLRHLDERLPGMEVALMPHQVMGVAWMLQKEESAIQGGCLADEMGLGKTIQMISCMVKNRSTDQLNKTNLIIAPLALLNQWKLEIEEKTDCGLTCLIYHGPSRTRRKSELMKYDVVLTTFNTMAMEWPDYETEMKKKTKAKKQRRDSFIVEDSDDEDMRNPQHRADKRKQQAGLLFQTEFYRIIADEGQQIRNRRTRMSRAITDLQTTYRWVLTGTPIVNSLSDVYGYIRFLRLRPWYDWQKFNTDIARLEKKRPSTAVARLQTVMKTFLLRRKKDSQLDGKNLIELPPKEVVLRRLEFSEEEREIYAMVEARSQAKFNRYLRAGTVLKNYHQVLVLLLRLRQICSHPCLIQEDGVAFVHRDEAHVKPEFATELTRARRLVSPEFVAKMQEKFKNQALARMVAEQESTNATIEEDDCPICYDVMTDAVITPCAHVFCRDCIVDVLNQAPPMDPADQLPGARADARPCPVCRSAISKDLLFSREVFEPSDKDLKSDGRSDTDAMSVCDSDDSAAIKGKGKGKMVDRPRRAGRRSIVESDDEGDDVCQSASENDDYDDDLSDFIVESDEDEEEKDARRALKKRQVKRTNIILDSDDEPDTLEEQEVIFGLKKKEPVTTDAVPTMSRFLPSSKMKYMMDQLKKLKQTNPEEKTLVVSQWTGCLSLVSAYLTENGIPHVKYQGDMNRPTRDQAVQVFMAKEKARIMLMSLKCGGVGLNLTRANNVISLDLGWSQAVEAQAYDRVHRLGQTRKVIVQRIVIADTVEDRILALQERKQALADGSLGEGNGKKIGKLSVKELANLFGLDARGRLLKED